jgi:hypothetical protein
MRAGKWKKPRILIGCEFSGIVRDAFLRRGYDAWSCDFLKSENKGPHLRGNVLRVLGLGWDLAIFHPPCTYLCNSGAKHLYRGGKKVNGRDPERWRKMRRAARFFRKLWAAPVARICIENPVMTGHAKKRIGVSQKQVIQPWMFGHGEIKATCLWLRGLPELEPTKIVKGRRPRVHHMSPGPERWKERSRTLAGIAEAMASQWGKYLE